MMNSRRREPRALFITFYLINRKKAVDPEHHSSKGVNFGFHVSKVHLYICRVIFISLLLYSDLYCKKMTHLFTAQTVVIVITAVKSKREKKRKGLKYSGPARFDPGKVTSYLKTLPRSNEGFLEITM